MLLHPQRLPLRPRVNRVRSTVAPIGVAAAVHVAITAAVTTRIKVTVRR